MQQQREFEPLLPKLGNITIRNFSNSGVWDTRTIDELSKLSDSLDTEGIDASHVNLSSIPDMWAQPLLFQMALYNTRHPLHKRVLGEWRGLLAILALREWRNLSSVRGVSVEIPIVDAVNNLADIDPTAPADPFSQSPVSPQEANGAKDPVDFLGALGKLLPSETLASDTGWNHLHLIGFGGGPIGITSPTTLVCTAPEYISYIRAANNDGNQGTVDWCAGEFLTDPKGKLGPTEESNLISWLEQLIANLRQHYEQGKAQFNTEILQALVGLLRNYQVRLGRSGNNPVPLVPLSDHSLGIQQGIFQYLDRPVGAVGSESSGSSIVLRDSQERTSLKLLVADPSIAEQWEVPQSSIVVWGTATMASYPPNGITDKRSFLGVPLENAQLRLLSDFFTDKLFVVNQPKAFPGAMMPNSAGSLQNVTPLMPIKDELLNYLSADELRQRITFESSGQSIIVKLQLTLSGLDGNGRTVTARREYSEKMMETIRALPVLEVWPNIIADNWRAYYTYFSTAEQATFYAEPYPLHDMEVQTFKDNRDPNRVGHEVTKTSSHPEAMICRFGEEDAGILMLKKPTTVSSRGGSWEIGIDFGTTGTNVYVNINDGGVANPVTFEDHHLMVTDSGAKRPILYDEFLPAGVEEGVEESPIRTPFLSIFHEFAVAGSGEERRTRLRPLLDGHIYFLADYRAFNENAGKNKGMARNLKWSSEPSVRYLTRAFMEQLCLQCSAEAALAEISRIAWKFSFPTAFSSSAQSTFREIWRQVAESCAKATGIALVIGTESGSGLRGESESIAAARFFAEHPEIEPGMKAKFGTGAVCVDIGGASSDISVWQQHTLRNQTSIRFAGRDIFLKLLHADTSFLELLSPMDPDIMTGLQSARRSNIDAFYTHMDVLISNREQAKKWLDSLVDLSDVDSVKGFRQLVAIGLAGLCYYVGLLLKHLDRSGEYAAAMPDIYIAGNGARIFDWVANGYYDHASPINELLKSVLRDASGFVATDFNIVVSPQPKAEVAFGLVSRTRLHAPADKLEASEVMSGEVFVKNGDKCRWSDFISAEHMADGLGSPDRLEQLIAFAKVFDEYARDGYIIEKKIALDESVMQEINRRLVNRFSELRQADAAEIHLEPPFFMVLKELLAIKADQWARASKTRASSAMTSGGKQAAIAVGRREQKGTSIQALCDLYNDAVDDPDMRDGFLTTHKPIRIGVANQKDREKNPDQEPIFQVADDGDYYAVARSGSKQYIVLPCFGMTLTEANYVGGAIGDVFDCPGHSNQYIYRHVKVEEPAYFESTSPEQWILSEPGQLDIGEGES